MPADAEDAAAEPAQCDAPKSLAAIAVTQKLELMELRPMLRNQALLMVFKQTLHRQKLCQLKVLHDLKYGMLECYEQRHSRDAKELVASAEEKLTFQVCDAHHSCVLLYSGRADRFKNNESKSPAPGMPAASLCSNVAAHTLVRWRADVCVYRHCEHVAPRCHQEDSQWFVHSNRLLAAAEPAAQAGGIKLMNCSGHVQCSAPGSVTSSHPTYL